MLRRIAARIRLIRIHRIYTARSLAVLLGVHVQSVRSWTKQGLGTIDPDDRPIRILGHDAKTFLRELRSKRRCMLQPDQFYCSRCRAPRQSAVSDLGLGEYRRTLSNVKFFVIRTGRCLTCGCRLRRFDTLTVDEIFKLGAIPTNAETRLDESLTTPVGNNIKEYER